MQTLRDRQAVKEDQVTRREQQEAKVTDQQSQKGPAVSQK
jgi:hypothetical protein